MDGAGELRLRPPVSEFRGPERIVFGQGATARLPELLGGLGARSLMVVVDAQIAADPLLSEVLATLARRGEVARHAHDGSEPSLEAAETIRRERGKGFDAVLAVGGGSTIDLAKAVALGFSTDRPLESFEGAGRVEGTPPPILALPTTAGTGSEVSGSSVLVHRAAGRKLSIRSPRLQPRVALLDPRLLATVPRGVIRAAGIDALAHAIEAYFSTGGSLLTDRLALGAMRCLSGALPRYYAGAAEPADLDAMAWGSCMAGIAFNSARVGLAHAVAAALGPATGLSHGLCVAVSLPEAIRLNAVSREADRAEFLAHLGLDPAAAGPIDAILLAWLAGLFRTLELPATLREAGCRLAVDEAIIDEIVAGGRLSTNPVPVDRALLAAVVRRVSGEEARP